MPITKLQLDRLLTPVRPDRIENKQGLSYVPAHEVKAELTRVFGPGNWDHTIHDVRLLWEIDTYDEGKKKTFYRACYLCACTLRVRDYEGNQIATITEYHAEANSNLPDRGEAHAMALTSVESYALRRAALDLGDAFGLHLYNNGSPAPLIKGTLAVTDPESPWHQVTSPRATGGDLTDEQRRVLQSSLGATPIDEEPAEAAS
jgi:hypothetical protein